MENFPEFRSTNINIRVSLGLKADLTNEAANMGCNLTECIMHLLTQGKTLKSKFEKLTVEHESLRAEAAQLITALNRYAQITDPMVTQLVDKEVLIKGKVVKVFDKFQAIELIIENYTPQKK